ncbi:MAG: Ig-like domain-containing protein [Gemmatimonadaceae bacterium]|nr:Ig-like domain-containing protein [Gemmatimonadaceae bacterium]
MSSTSRGPSSRSSSFRGSGFRLSLSVLFAATLAACTQDSTTTPIPVASIALTPENASVSAGATVPLSATLKDAAGQVVTGQPITWSSNNTAVATVSRSGVVTTLSPGSARIAASSFGKSATATITVTAKPVAAVVLSPASVSMQVGTTSLLQARPVDADGATLTGRSVAWSSSNTAVATVSQTGTITALSPGATTITATSEGRSAQSAVTVTLPAVNSVTVTPTRDTIGVGTERQLTAVLRDAAGNALTGRVLTWGSSNVAVASVSSTGLVVGVAPGTVTITGTSEGRVGSATIVVLARLASAVILTPGSGTLVVGTTQPLTTQITDALGNLLTDRPVSYASDAPAVASVSATGVVTALSAGTARITATSEGKSGTATFTVIPIPVARVDITPTPVVLLPGGIQQLTAVARSASGAILTGRTVTWVSGAPSVVTVSSTGVLTAAGNGVAVVLALVDDVAGSVTVTVGPPAIASITISPASPSVSVNTSLQLTATLRDASGNALAGRSITWTSADESIAFVSSTGQVLGLKPGTVRITATSEGVSASTVLTVR